MSVEPNDHRVGRWAVALAATALIAGGGFGGLAYAGDGVDDIGAPGEDGADVTCTAYLPPVSEPVCNVVGEDGADGENGETGE